MSKVIQTENKFSHNQESRKTSRTVRQRFQRQAESSRDVLEAYKTDMGNMKDMAD
jgi:hypothetical protein